MNQKPRWTKQDITAFDRLVDGTSSRDQVKRIKSRLDLSTFVESHGREKCDAMFAHLEAGGARVDGPLVDA